MTWTPAVVRLVTLIVPVSVIAAMQAFGRGLPVTGDEPEYVYYAYSFFVRHDFAMPVATFFAAFPRLAGIPPENLQGHGHPVLLSILGSPFVGYLGIPGARLFSVGCGLVGFVAIRRLIAGFAGINIATLVSLFIFVTFPVLAYLHLFYTDMTIMAVVAWAWLLIQSSRSASLLIATALAVTLPFLHIRMSLVAAWLVLLVVASALRKTARGRVRLIAGVACIAAAALAGFVWHQYVLFGSLIGGASTPEPVSFVGYFARLALQALDFRHGLITYNPAMILAFAGLVIGVVSRSRLAIEGSGLILIYSVCFVFGAASESFPARFWVPGMPALAVGLGLWLRHARSVSAYLSGGLLGAMSLLNLAVYLRDPVAFLGNRQASLTYDNLFDVFPYLDLAGLFPWDGFNYAAHGVEPHPEISLPILAGASAVAVLLVAAFVLEAVMRRGRRLVALLPPIVLLVPFWYALMRPVPASAVQVVRSGGDNQQPGTILIRFCKPIDAALIRFFGQPRALMRPPSYPNELLVEGSSDGINFHVVERYPMSPVIVLPREPLQAIRLSAITTPQNHGWTDDRVSVLMKGGLPKCGASSVQP